MRINKRKMFHMKYYVNKINISNKSNIFKIFECFLKSIKMNDKKLKMSDCLIKKICKPSNLLFVISKKQKNRKFISQKFKIISLKKTRFLFFFFQSILILPFKFEKKNLLIAQ